MNFVSEVSNLSAVLTLWPLHVHSKYVFSNWLFWKSWLRVVAAVYECVWMIDCRLVLWSSLSDRGNEESAVRVHLSFYHLIAEAEGWGLDTAARQYFYPQDIHTRSHTDRTALRSNWGSSLRILWHQAEDPEIKPRTFQSSDDPLYLLSHRRPSGVI